MNNYKKAGYFISNEESERIQVLKIWFTIMIIFIHSYTEEVHFTDGNLVLQIPIWLDWVKYIISQVISRCAVPGYFFISAVLLYRKDFTWIENIKKKCKSLLIPYLIFNTVWIIIYFIVQHIPVASVYFSSADNIIADWGFVQYANAFLGFKNTYPILYPLWFMRDLMVLNVLAVAIKKLIDRFPKYVFICLTLMILFNLQTHLFFLGQSAVVYFSLGYYFVKYSGRFNRADKIRAPFLAASYLVSIVLDCITRYAAIHYLFHFISITIGLIFFYRFTTKISNECSHRILLETAKYSFSIYLFHEMNLTILRKLLTKLLPSSAFWQAVLYFGTPVIIFIGCLLLSILLDKRMHKLYSILVGNRFR